MNVRARCLTCGDTFALPQLLEEGAGGRCPRCGVVLAPSYTPVLDLAVRDLLAAADTLDGALRQVRGVAPGLEVDVRRLGMVLEAGR